MKLGPMIRLCTATTYISSYHTWYCEMVVHEKEQAYHVESDVGLVRAKESALEFFPLCAVLCSN